jgi:hypothetical protein
MRSIAKLCLTVFLILLIRESVFAQTHTEVTLEDTQSITGTKTFNNIVINGTCVGTGCGGGGGGAVTGCATTGGVGYQNGTSNTLTCGANLTYVSSNLLSQSAACPLSVIVTLTACGNNAGLGLGPFEIIQTSTTPPNGCGLVMSNSNSAGNSGTSRAIYSCFDQTTNGGFAWGQVFPSGGTGVLNFVGSGAGNQGNMELGTNLANGTDFVEFYTVNDGSGGFQSTNGKPQSYIGPFSSGSTSGPSACETAFGITTLSGASTNTGLNCLPANSIIDAVLYRITTTITTAVSFTIGDGTIATRFCGTQSTMTAGTTGTCFAQADQTGTSGPRQVSAAVVKITPNTTPGAGAMRLIVYYHTWVVPTS